MRKINIIVYHYETKNVNKAMKRNIERFPEDFCFQLADDEFKNLRFQFGTTSENSNISKLDIQIFNKEYPILKVTKTDKFHDRFIIIDNKELYHCDASIKDLEKKCFGINKIEDIEIINKFVKMQY